MCCDAELKKTNSTPLIYNHILLKEGGQEKFMKELAALSVFGMKYKEFTYNRRDW